MALNHPCYPDHIVVGLHHAGPVLMTRLALQQQKHSCLRLDCLSRRDMRLLIAMFLKKMVKFDSKVSMCVQRDFVIVASKFTGNVLIKEICVRGHVCCFVPPIACSTGTGYMAGISPAQLSAGDVL